MTSEPNDKLPGPVADVSTLDAQKWRTACHEAGHAIQAWKVGATIAGFWMHRIQVPAGWQHWIGRVQVEHCGSLDRRRTLLMAVAGVQAERRLLGSARDYSAEEDLKHVKPPANDEEIKAAAMEVDESTDWEVVKQLAKVFANGKAYPAEIVQMDDQHVVGHLRRIAPQPRQDS